MADDPMTNAPTPTAAGTDAAAGGIVVRGLHKRYDTVDALAGVDLEVPAGETVVLLGPNGAGKSTLLRILGTTVLADAGTASVDGHDVADDAAAARIATGLVLGDERSWYWRLSGLENLAFFARMYGYRRRAAVAVAGELLALVDLTDAGDRRIEGYSSGMRSRLAIARALLGDPPVLLLDEPTRALDPIAAAAFRAHAGELAATGRSVLYATHDLHEAAALNAAVIILDHGRIAARAAAGATAAQLEALLLASVR
ncbi:MAG: ABC transporter ATP-binding protein [Microthrixaceae bacterium]